MATYAIGDVQGCYRELRLLLRECGFDARRDRLWFAGDLVNRGPASLEVLRFVTDLGDRARIVLGNHDLHLIASARGIRPLRAKDTFGDVLDAAEGEALVDWLRERPVIHRDPERGYVMVHAGIAPAWTIDDALVHGAELSRALRAPDPARLLSGMYGNAPDVWRESLPGSTGCASSPTPSRECATAAAMAGLISPTPARPARSIRRSLPGLRSATPARTVPGSCSATGRPFRSKPPFPATCTFATSTPAACGAARSPRCAWRTTGSSASAARAAPHRPTSERLPTEISRHGCDSRHGAPCSALKHPGRLEPCRSFQLSQVSERVFLREGTRLRQVRGARGVRVERSDAHALSVRGAASLEFPMRRNLTRLEHR